MELDDIKKDVDELAEKIDSPEMFLPTYGYSEQSGRHHIEINGIELHYIVCERGQELNRRSTIKLDELLYWIFSDATFSMACKYEVAHREEAKDFRRIMFTRQEELLGILSDGWREKKIQDHYEILKKSPFDDLAGLRARYFAILRSQGYPEHEIRKLAYEKYPSNTSDK